VTRFPAFLTFVLFFASVAAAAPAADRSPEPATLAEQYLLSAANQERSALGLPPLHRDVSLTLAAERHARLMAAHTSISHQFSGEPELAARAASAGVRFSVVEENVGEAPSVLTIHTLWMKSPHHRDNLLDPGVDAAGISVIARNGELFAVEDFARTVRAVSYREQESAIANLLLTAPSSASLSLLSTSTAIDDARGTCAMSTGYAGTRRPWFVMRFTSDSLSTLPAELTRHIASGKYHEAAVGACAATDSGAFTSYNFAVLLYP
jgi:uncharacterized protein YkwD